MQRRRPCDSQPNVTEPALRVFIVSASIGGGHDGAAAELARRLEISGAHTLTVDFLDQLPIGLGWLIRSIYSFQLRFVPQSYEALYRFCMIVRFSWRPTVAISTVLSRRRLLRRLREFNPSVVVSVYPLASLALGRMRTKRWLNVAAVTYLTDFSVHPLWLHPGVDLHLAIHRATAQSVSDQGARAIATVGPLVRPMFSTEHNRSQLRAELGIPNDKSAVLVVAGSWGVGSVADTVKAIAESGAFHPVCICGRNAGLQRRLERLGIGTVIGWTDQMADYMAACDVAVENAGGLTCMEALASGLPVITFDPIPGHGRHNAELMAAAGVVRYARDRDELRAALETLVDPSCRVPPAQNGASSLDVLDAAGEVRSLAAASPAPRRVIREPMAMRRLCRALLLIVVMYVGATEAFGVVAVHGLGVDATGSDTQRATVVGVRLRSDQLGDGQVANALADDNIVAVVDGRDACAAAANVKSYQVKLASTGDGLHHSSAWRQAKFDTGGASQEIQGCTGERMKWFVALREVTAFDWAYARATHRERILDPQVVGPYEPLEHLAPHRLYVIDATSVSAVDARHVIDLVATAQRNQEITTLGATR